MIRPADMLIVIAAPFIGSFVTMLACRLPAGAPIALARSACPDCRATLSPVSLVPVISWVAQRGRCRHCQGRISPAYPLVEIAALLLAVWTMSVMTAAAGWMLAASCVLGWTLLALALIDVRHFILPDALTLPLAAAGLMVTLAVDPGRFTSHLAASLAGFAAFALIGILYRRIRGRDGLGLGDAKLLAAGGAWVGFEGLAGILLVASFTALGWALVQGAIRRELSSRTRIAFGPFLAFGIWIVWLYGPVEFGYMTWTI